MSGIKENKTYFFGNKAVLFGMFLVISLIFLFLSNFKIKIIGNYYYHKSLNQIPSIKLVLSSKKTKELNLSLDTLKANYKLGYFGKYKKFKTIIIEEELKKEVKVSLHGHFLDHWNKNNPSFKVKVRNSQTILDMYSFLVLPPKTRDYLGDWTAGKLSEKYGLLNLKRTFILFSTNKISPKVYLLEESFASIGKRLKHQGLAFKYSFEKDSLNINIYNNHYEDSTRIKIQSLMNKFIKNPNKFGFIFDMNKMAKYYLITDITQGFHQLAECNTHFFYNFKTSKIEPIGREWSTHTWKLNDPQLTCNFVNDTLNFSGYASIIHKKMFSNLELQKLYKIKTNNKQVKSQLKEIQLELQFMSNCLWKQRGTLHFDNKYILRNVLYRNSQEIKFQ